MKRHTIEKMRSVALERGGKCLSDEYVNNKTKLRWKCQQGHIWEAVPSSVLIGNWCPKCVGLKKLTIKEMMDIARQRGGKCLSRVYVNSKTKLKWRCSKGHVWEAKPNGIKSGNWCPACSGKRKHTLREMNDLAAEKGGKCLSKRYVNSKTKLKWQCPKGHVWLAEPSVILRGHWCPECAGLKPLTIEEMHQIAKARSGKCLSKEYVNAYTHLEWQCADGHIWQAAPLHIKDGKWCPICSQGVSERACRSIFEYITNHSFPKKRPKWLVNARGNRMELDGFCPELSIAFEYQGEQHYKTSPIFHKGEHNLERRKLDDAQKVKQCEERGIKLFQISIEIPLQDLQDYITSILLEHFGKDIDLNLEKIDINELDINNSLRLSELKDIAIGHGGRCLSDIYISDKNKMSWECSEGHNWRAMPASVKKGHWCPVCGAQKSIESRRDGIELMKQLALEKGGRCLSDEYLDNKTKLKWSCKHGHIWEAVPKTIKKGHWCPKCVGLKKLTIKEMMDIARQRGGKCLSRVYVNSKTKLKWRCSKGHVWEAKPNGIKSGNWCPYCAPNASSSLKKLR